MAKTGTRWHVGYLDGHADQEDDPYQSPGAAPQAVIDHAVKTAVASLPISVPRERVMLSVPRGCRAARSRHNELKQMITAGQLASVTIGRRRLVLASSVRAFGRTTEEDEE